MRNRFRSDITRWLMGIVQVAVVMSLSLPAAADPPADAIESSMAVQQMVVVGFDAAVAEAAGYVVVTVDGVQGLVPASAVGDGATPIPEPDNQIGGNCGYSYAYLTDIGPNNYRVRTGFHTNIESIAYTWFADVTSNDPQYSRLFQKSGTLLLRKDWDWRPTGTVPDDGYFKVQVSTASWAELWTGAYCNSAGPWEVQYIN